METEKDFIMRQVKQIAKNLGLFLSKESLKEIVNTDLSSQDSLTDEEIDQILIISSLKETIVRNQLSEEFIKSAIGLSAEEIENVHNLAIKISREQIQKINELLDMGYFKEDE